MDFISKFTTFKILFFFLYYNVKFFFVNMNFILTKIDKEIKAFGSDWFFKLSHVRTHSDHLLIKSVASSL